MEIFSGFVIGLLGSFHCIGMCGPIVLALPIDYKSRTDLIIGRMMYNIGRVITYTLIGIIVGAIGQKVYVIGAQQYASVGFGVIILISVFLPASVKNSFNKIFLIQWINSFVKKSFSKLIGTAKLSNLFLFGLINGLLPCGFVYVALAGAISIGNIISSAVFMALFGLGTVPIMFATSLFGGFINNNLRTRINKLLPVLTIILAILFILRGLNLGIPMLSPKMDKFS